MQTLLYNKNKPVSGEKINDMILELRQLINDKHIAKPGKSTPNSQTEQKKQAKSKNIESLIQQSTKLIQKSENKKNLKPSIRGKILAASEILKDENQLIKSYIRDKIQSQLFSSKIDNQFVKNSFLQQEKQKIIRLKEKELEKQNRNKKQIIQNVKEFHHGSRVKVSIHEIDSLIYKQDPNSSYLLSIDNGKKIASNSNQIKNENQFFRINEEEQNDPLINNPNGTSRSNFNLREKFAKSNKAKSQHIEPQFDQEFKEFTEEPQGHEKFSNLETNNPALMKVNDVLSKYPKFVKIFCTFLKNQIKINNLDSAFNLMPQILNDQKAMFNQIQKGDNSDSFFWKSNKSKSTTSFQKNIKKSIAISNIFQTYRFKGFGINEQSKVDFERRKISERRINKMIGQSKNFHPKKCVLTKNQLIYYEQKDKSQQSNSQMFQMLLPQSTKKIDLQIQRIIPDNFSKQEGGFFYKKELNIQIIDLKGKNRGIKFEKNFLEGQELMYDLKKLMANKIYRQNCVLSGANSISLYEFVNDLNSKSLQISTDYLISPSTQKQQKKLLILTDLSYSRTNVQQLKIKNMKLPINQLNEIFSQSKQFQKLKKIQLTNIKLNTQSFLSVCQFVNEIFSKNQLQVSLKDTKLDDECFTSNIGSFTSFCSKVKFLDISQNNITAKTLQIIKNCLESVTTIIQRLNISYCPIVDIVKITALIKEARKLQALQAECCDLDLDLLSQLQFEKAFQFLKKCCPTFKHLNLSKNGAIKPSQYEIIEKMWFMQSIEHVKVDIDLMSYQELSNQSKNKKPQDKNKPIPSNCLYLQVKRQN